MRRQYKYFLLVFCLIFFLGGRPAEFAQEATFFQGFLIPKPVIRVALGVNLEDIRVQASSGMKLYLANANYKLLADDVADVRIKGTKEKLSEKFTVVVAQSRRREDAEKTAKDLRTKLTGRIFVAEDRSGGLEGVFQVRAGDFLARSEALSFVKRMNLLGMTEAWIVREEVTEPSSKPRWVLINDELLDLDERTTLYVIPSNAQSYLSFGGKSYRGIFVLRGSRRGVLLVNIVNLEDYLKGVVPGELSPYHFGEIEALKAQAVAARTYALKNIGQFEALGFDLYDTPASQVYDGLGIEHPLSGRAVEETRGQVAVYGGRLINALYMSTCGGATEDGEAMFGGPQVPYLKSTECLWESQRVLSLQTTAMIPSVFARGRDVGPALARLAAFGIVAPAAETAWYQAPISGEEALDWSRRAVAAAGKAAGKVAPPAEIVTPLALGRLLAAVFLWDERIQTLVGKSEADQATKDWPELRPEDRPLVAFLLTSGILEADLGEDRKSPLSRAQAAVMIDRAVALSRDTYHRGNIEGLSKGEITLAENGEVKTLPLAPEVLLIRSFDGASSSVAALEFEGGETVKWIETEGRVRLLEFPVVSLSPVLDEPSPYRRWQVRVSREDLENRLNQYYPLGKLIDLVPKKRGVSKRLLDLLVVGQEGQVHVTGLKIRQVLGLRDNLFVVDREVDAEGRVTHFIFAGKGWGHGVGLCQVGAFRMAQKGAPYDEILKKYYRGIKIKKEY